MIRIVLSSNHALVKSGIRKELASKSEVAIVGEANTFEETIEKCSSFLPDILLVELEESNSASKFLGDLSVFSPCLKTIILTASEHTFYAPDLQKEGIRGCLVQDDVFRDIFPAVCAVAGGGGWMSKCLFDAPLIGLPMPAQTDTPFTYREAQVIQWLSRGLSNEQIAQRLCISVRTIRFHVENLMKKLQVNNRTELVVTATRRGWVNINN